MIDLIMRIWTLGHAESIMKVIVPATRTVICQICACNTSIITRLSNPTNIRVARWCKIETLALEQHVTRVTDLALRLVETVPAVDCKGRTGHARQGWAYVVHDWALGCAGVGVEVGS